MEVRKKEGEATTSLMYRFNKKVRQSGILKEVKGRRFKKREENKTRRKKSALYKSAKQEEVKRLKKLGKI